ncbi:hypothetical protein ACIBF6_43900 [Streptosporangium amethystogenes]|uniref:hypothetical protein n=1 Tax=Streptosporangium amethystogenes TaxID=2002 RepID=UPI0037AF8AC9
MYRKRDPRPRSIRERKPFHHPAELSQEERAHVLAALDSPRFVDRSPGQVWAILPDEGTQSTMYRLLRERGRIVSQTFLTTGGSRFLSENELMIQTVTAMSD